MMTDKPRGVTLLGTAVIIYGAYNLLGLGNYANFARMFQPLPKVVVTGIYVFSLIYGICAVYCGMRVLRRENWARVLLVVLTAMSLVAGFALNGIVMDNLKRFIASGEAEIPPGMEGTAFVYAAVIIALVTAFELAVVFYFTRPKVAAAFK